MDAGYTYDANGADAQSNLMATYEGLAVAERPIYGSSRPGGVPLGDYRGGTAPGTLALGRRRYELTNHLGADAQSNVLATVGDRAKYENGQRAAEVLSGTDYLASRPPPSGRPLRAGASARRTTASGSTGRKTTRTSGTESKIMG